MAGLSRKEREYLRERFPGRVNFDRTERMLYGHDIASVPKLLKPLIGGTTPRAVVQPADEAELAELVTWASGRGIPLTPRGKATSGYGGVLPVRKGLVVDFYRMRDVVEISPENLTATVEPGITWEQLDERLKPKGLTLRTYPTSYPSSTVGGWLAHGGAGLGGYEFGYFADNVVSARVVPASGEVRDVAGDDLDLVSDAMGTTGLVSRVTVRVMPAEELDVISISCSDAHDLQRFIERILAEGLPVWSMMFINPRMAHLKNLSPLREHHGEPVEERVLLPETYVMTLTFRKSDADRIHAYFDSPHPECSAEILSDKIARHEWENRFNLMVVKRLGPSLVPAEVVVPLAALGDVMTEIEDKLRQPVVKEAVIIREGRSGVPEAVILGFIPADERRFGYTFLFALSLSIMKIALRHGGRPYATGLYFAGLAGKILGADRVGRLRAAKREADPRGLLNPRKVLSNGLVGAFMGLAGFFEPLVRALGNGVSVEIGERPKKPVRGIPADVAWYAYSCSQCGYCVDACDQFYGRGWESQSPRGKWYWLRRMMEGKVKWDQAMVDTFLVCTTCELCNLRCSASLPIEPAWMKLRGKLIQDDGRMTFPPFEVMGAATTAQGNIWAGYRKNRADWFPEDLREKHGPGVKAPVVYFAGCTASYVEHDIAQATVRLLDEAGVDFTTLGEVENCCGTPMLVAGKWDVFLETVRKNIAAVKATGAKTVVTSCPACDMMWRHHYAGWAEELGVEYDIETKHYSEIIAGKLAAGEFEFPENGGQKEKVTWHDSCHIGRVSGVYEEPRAMIKAVPGVEFVEMAHNRENGHCCGSVLTLIKDPPVAADIGAERLGEAVDAGAEKVLALCPCCEFQLRVSRDKKDVKVQVQDLARFAAGKLGYDFPDPEPEVRRQWAVFEKMIALMTPQGFADLMDTMWPELLKAMPLGMGAMMRFIGRLGPVGGGMLFLMRPLFPILFPLLLPGMMPKVMGTMLDRIGGIVPMPDYMAEQMPGLMPGVMDRLLPHMVRDLVPHAVPKMIKFLRTQRKRKKEAAVTS